MSEAAAESAWLRERVWQLQADVAGHGARIDGLHSADGQHSAEIKDIREDIASLREAVNTGFRELQKNQDFHLGQMRAEMAALKVAPPEGKALPVRWLAMGVLITAALVGGLAYGIGYAANPAHVRQAIQSITAQ